MNQEKQPPTPFKLENMKSGIELIAEERQEQITKHGFSIDSDKYYANHELVLAARYCLMLAESSIKLYAKYSAIFWPEGWDSHFEHKILNKNKVGKLIVAGAFLKAENDRRKDNFWDDTISMIAHEIDLLHFQNESNGK